jgi:Holliday junction resolvasome RuvABC DNA-binding subunit
MSIESSSNGTLVLDQASSAELLRAIEARDWATVDRITGMTPEEAERILKEETFIDAAEVNRLMEELDRAEETQDAAQGLNVAPACGKPA